MLPSSSDLQCVCVCVCVKLQEALQKSMHMEYLQHLSSVLSHLLANSATPPPWQVEPACVCMCMYVCVCVYKCVYVCTSRKSIHVYVHSIYPCALAHMHMCLFCLAEFGHIRILTCMYIPALICIDLCVHIIYTYIHVCIWGLFVLYLANLVYVCTSTYVHFMCKWGVYFVLVCIYTHVLTALVYISMVYVHISTIECSRYIYVSMCRSIYVHMHDAYVHTCI